MAGWPVSSGGWWMVLPKVLLAGWGDGAQEHALTLFLISAHAMSECGKGGTK